MAYQNYVRIEQLNNENFDTWKIQMEAILIKNDLWEYVNNANRKPAEAAKVAEWEHMDKKAKTDLLLAISPSLLKDVKDCTSSHDVWEKLKEVHDSSGPARKATLLKQLILTKAKSDDNINDHISKFFDVVNKLKSVDVTIDDDLLCILLLYSLPENFESFRIAIESRDELPQPSILKVKIAEEYNARKSQLTELYSDTQALAVHQSNHKKSGKKFGRGKLTCFICRKVGHKASSCRYKRSEKKNEYSTIGEESTLFTSEKLLHHKGKWILDSGATSHMAACAKKFVNMQEVDEIEVNLANHQTTSVEGKGFLKIKPKTGTIVNLKDVLYVPNLRTNLLSVSKITDNNHTVIFSKNEAIVKNPKNQIIFKALKNNGLYHVIDYAEEANLISKNVDDLTIWHQRFGHLNFKTLTEMINKNKVKGIQMEKCQPKNELVCEICIQAKQIRKPFEKNKQNRCRNPLEIIHSDLCGPMNVRSQGGALYFISFIDDSTRWCEIYLLKHKNEALEKFKSYKAKVETFIGKKIKNLRTDNGKEYVNQKFTQFLMEHGIQHQLTAEYTPQQNGVAERKNRTLIEMARCMLIQSNLTNSLWAEAITTANYIRNRCPSRSLNNEIPYRLWKNKEVHVKHFRTFGTLTYVLQKGPKRGKFDAKSKPFYLMGYCENSKTYRLWNKETKNIIKSRDVVFVNENENPQNKDGEETKNILEIYQEVPEDEIQATGEDKGINKIEDSINKKALHDEKNDIDSEQKEPNNGDQDENLNDRNERRFRGRPRIVRTGERGRPKKVYNTKQKNEEMNTEIIACTDVNTGSDQSDNYETPDEDSSTFSDLDTYLATDDEVRDINEWNDAILKELQAHIKNGTWTIVEKPKNKKIIGCRWVLTNKVDADKSVKKKARLVAKGCSQRAGIDFHETYAPVARQKSIRTLIAMAVELNFKLYQFDVVTAYLNGQLEERIYMEIPKYYEIFRQEKIENKVCELKKSIYGLRQSGRVWYQKLDSYLKNIGCIQMKNEPCMYIYKDDTNIKLIIAVYVDDIIVAASSNNEIEWFKQKLTEKFETKFLGKLQHCLGVEFNQLHNGDVEINQKMLIQRILKKFNMSDCKIAKTPIDPHTKLSKEMCPTNQNEKNEMRNIPYQNLIGSLLYLAITTRPDINYAVNVLSKYNNNFGKGHWTAAKRVLRYLKGSINFGLYFRKTGQDLEGYVDADWASDTDSRKSYTGFLFKLADGPISWEIKNNLQLHYRQPKSSIWA